MQLNDLEVLYTASNITISWNAKDHYLYAGWVGFQEELALKLSGEKMLEFMKKKRCSKILNDNTQVIGPWYHSVDWTNTNWFPRMEKAGLKHFAWVCPEDLFAQLSAARALVGQEVVKTFRTMDKAVEWINSRS